VLMGKSSHKASCVSSILLPLHEYQNKRLTKSAFHKLLILKNVAQGDQNAGLPPSGVMPAREKKAVRPKPAQEPGYATKEKTAAEAAAL